MENIFTFLLENYGAFGVILICVGGLGWLMIKELKKSNETLIANQQKMSTDLSTSVAKSITGLSENLTNDLREQNKQLIQYIVNREHVKDEKHNKNLIDRRNITQEVNSIINDTRNLLEANRAFVLEFHNSFANQTGFPFLKYTMTYEKISRGCLPIQQQYQSTAFASLSEICENILSQPNHIFMLNSHEEIEKLCPIMITDGRPICGMLWKGIFNSKNNLLIGLLGFEYTEKMYNGYDKVEIITAARNIGELITLTNNSGETYEQ